MVDSMTTRISVMAHGKMWEDARGEHERKGEFSQRPPNLETVVPKEKWSLKGYSNKEAHLRARLYNDTCATTVTLR